MRVPLGSFPGGASLVVMLGGPHSKGASMFVKYRYGINEDFKAALGVEAFVEPYGLVLLIQVFRKNSSGE